MRAACLQAQADRASPVVLKAVLRAVSTAFDDFSHSVSSPGKLLVVVLFVISGLFMPVSTWIRALLPADPPVEPGKHVVVMAAHPADALGQRVGFRQRVSSALRRRKVRALNYKDDIETDNGTVNIDLFEEPCDFPKWD